MESLDGQAAYTQFWLENARRGLIVVRGLLEQARCEAIDLLVRGWEHFGFPQPSVTIRIDCPLGGDAAVWRAAKTIAAVSKGRVETIVEGRAASAGLILALAGDSNLGRHCLPESTFSFHGTPYKPGCSGVATEEDDHRSEWFAERTGQPVAFWLGKAASGRPFEFDAKRALRLGVVHRILTAEDERV